MANRAQRRANNKAAKRAGENGQPQGTQSATNQAMFNNAADRVADGKTEWVPGRVNADGDTVSVDSLTPSVTTNPSLSRKRTWKDWMRFGSWVLIALSAVTFLVVMWIPSLPLWAIITVAAVFAVGVLSLFVVRGNHDKNPYLDDNGTAV
jgi:hypothetical protein